MSGTRRVKALDYDEDDLDDGYSEEEYGEEGGDGMTDEDRELMRQGIIKVKEGLPAGIDIPEQEIQEALYYYYYDVSKSLTYMKNKYSPKQSRAQAKAAKPVSRFDQAADSAAKAAPKKQTELLDLHPVVWFEPDYLSPPTTAADFFKDTPWLGVPIDRLGNMTHEPRLPKGGLLGGSSKLAALAAARKKKQQEQQAAAAAAAAASPVSKDEIQASDRAVSLLDRLGGSGGYQTKGRTSSTSTKLQGKENKPILQTSKPLQLRPAVPTDDHKKKPMPDLEEPSRKRKADTPPEEVSKDLPVVQVEPQDLQGQPSTFASTLLHSTLQWASTDSSMKTFTLTYPADLAPFAGPSPDDVVLKAQSQAKGNKDSAKSSKGTTAAGSISEGVANLAVEEAIPTIHKKLDVLKEFEKSNMKRSSNFVVIGHVDHGKSTLIGRLLYDLKVVDQRTIDKLRKEADSIGKSSFAFAWVMDSYSDERERGITVDVGLKHFETDRTRFTLLDAPGHQDFVPEMIAGVSQADFGVLIVDAGTNNFDAGLRGQTKEHALLARGFGITRLVVVVNKMDTVGWSKNRFEEVSQQLAAFLTASGFQRSKLSFIPCAGLTGDNLVRAPPKDTASWYTGRTVLEELESCEATKRETQKPLRLAITNIFKGSVMNPVSISGRIESGSFQVGDRLVAMPSRKKFLVKGIEADGEPVGWAVAGQIVDIHLADIEMDDLRYGDIVCFPKDRVWTVKSFKARILAFEPVFPMFVQVHRGRLDVQARITSIEARLHKYSGEVLKTKPQIVQVGQVARVEVELDSELPLEKGTRVVLRNNGVTIACALIE